MFGHRLLPGVWPRLLQTQIKRGRSSFERFEAHCAGNVCDASESFGMKKSESAHSMHRLRAVEQGKSLFCFETLSLKSSARQRFPAFHSFALKKCIAFANQGQSEMRERREIAAGADRAFLRNDRVDAPVEHFAKHLDDFKADSAESESKHVGPQQHHRARLRLRKWIANSASVTANKIELELSQIVLRDANIR